MTNDINNFDATLIKIQKYLHIQKSNPSDLDLHDLKQEILEARCNVAKQIYSLHPLCEVAAYRLMNPDEDMQTVIECLEFAKERLANTQNGQTHRRFSNPAVPLLN